MKIQSGLDAYLSSFMSSLWTENDVIVDDERYSFEKTDCCCVVFHVPYNYSIKH